MMKLLLYLRDLNALFEIFEGNFILGLLIVGKIVHEISLKLFL